MCYLIKILFLQSMKSLIVQETRVISSALRACVDQLKVSVSTSRTVKSGLHMPLTDLFCGHRGQSLLQKCSNDAGRSTDDIFHFYYCVSA
jgi:hypothetical protein